MYSANNKIMLIIINKINININFESINIKKIQWIYITSR